MKKISFREISPAESKTIHDLAWAIWPAAYKDILSADQISYMLHKFYTEEAITDQMLNSAYKFVLVYADNECAGFGSWTNEGMNVYKIQKLYILPALQGTGIGKELLFWIIAHVKHEGAKEIILNVNRDNKARYFYEKLGFTIKDQADISIGNGYFMNDYIMTTTLEK